MATRKMECVRCKMPIVYEETQKQAICPRCGERNKTIHVRKKMSSRTKRLLKKIAIIALIVLLAAFALIGAIIPWLSDMIGSFCEERGYYAPAKFFLRMAGDEGRERANVLVLDHPKVGDTCYLGTYEQDGDLENGVEPLKWQVLAVEEDRALLVADRVIDSVQMDPDSVQLTWETSTLRAWLNDEFYNTNFTDEDKVRILFSEIENPDNVRYETKGGNNTQDYVFLLSHDELKTYFKGDKYFTYPTQYAIDEDVMVGYETSYAWWWLRSPGFYQDMVAVCATRDADVSLVEFGRDVDMLEVGTYVTNRRMGLRPAVWIDTANAE